MNFKFSLVDPVTHELAKPSVHVTNCALQWLRGLGAAAVVPLCVCVCIFLFLSCVSSWKALVQHGQQVSHFSVELSWQVSVGTSPLCHYAVCWVVRDSAHGAREDPEQNLQGEIAVPPPSPCSVRVFRVPVGVRVLSFRVILYTYVCIMCI